MAEIDLERFYITHSTPRGLAVLQESEPLQEAMHLFAEAEKAEDIRVSRMHFLGRGKYALTFLIDRVAVKVSTRTSTQEARLPEDLTKQFSVQQALWAYLRQRKGSSFTAPEQFFAARTPRNAFILAQEFMDGWTTLEKRATQLYGYHVDDMSESAREQKAAFDNSLRHRMARELGEFSLLESLNDIVKKGKFHGGNLLVPALAELSSTTPICIIDQGGCEADIDP